MTASEGHQIAVTARMAFGWYRYEDCGELQCG